MSATGDPALAPDAGVTLIEALAVVAVVALAATIGFARLQQAVQTLAWRQATVAMGMRLRETRAAALRHGRAEAFAVTADGRGYRAAGVASPSPAGATLALAGDAPILFQPDGSSSGGVLVVRRPRGAPARLRVEPDTGAVAEARP